MTTTEQNPSQPAAISDLVSTPVVFAVDTTPGGGVHVYSTFLDTRSGVAPKNLIAGSIVTRGSVPGASMRVIATQGIHGGKKTQRLLLSGISPKAPVFHQTIDFLPTAVGDDGAGDGGNLTMVITSGVHHPNVDVEGKKGARFNLSVAPDAAVMITAPGRAAADLLGFNWNDAFNIAKVVVPAIAKTGYSVYKELKTQNSAPQNSNELEGWFDSVMSVAKVAAPIAGALLL